MYVHYGDACQELKILLIFVYFSCQGSQSVFYILLMSDLLVIKVVESMFYIVQSVGLLTSERSRASPYFVSHISWFLQLLGTIYNSYTM